MEKHYLVIRNDSILKLASMSKEEQEDFFKDYIAKLKIEDAKRQKQIEEEATIFQTQTGGRGGFDSSFGSGGNTFYFYRSEEHTSELQSRGHLVCRLLLEKKNNKS